MEIMKKEILVIGAGPAGLSASIKARKAGASVMLVDENRRAGGQLYKQTHKFFGSSDHYAGVRGFEIAEELYKKAIEFGVEISLNTIAYGIYKEGVGIVKDGRNYIVKASKIIVAAGGTENPVVFEGSTLPGVMTAGSAQTFVNVDRVKPGACAVVLGSGNVGLIVANQLIQAGIKVAAIVEKSNKIGGYAVHAAKVLRAGVPIMTNSNVVKALGEDELTAVTVNDADGNNTVIESDLLCIATGMSPLTELLWQAGAEMRYVEPLGGYIPVYDKKMETTAAGVYVAGDAAGVEEAPIAIEEGNIAGLSSAESLGYLDAVDANTKRSEMWKAIAEYESDDIGKRKAEARADGFKEKRCLA